VRTSKYNDESISLHALRQQSAAHLAKDLDRIASDVRKFKDSLRLLVDERRGIGKLATLTAIPQPSLSRFFASASMPRRTTLHKIARVLGLNQIQIATEWSV
jgi:DNA-binding phage protein